MLIENSTINLFANYPIGLQRDFSMYLNDEDWTRWLRDVFIDSFIGSHA